MLVATVIGVTVLLKGLVTYAAPLGMIAIADGPLPAGIGVPAVLVASSWRHRATATVSDVGGRRIGNRASRGWH